jgi:SAM-dependent methyltransferase
MIVFTALVAASAGVKISMTMESPRISEEALFPWGRLFALRENFEFGFFSEERRLVAKYLTKPSDILVIGSGNGREARPICRDGHRIVCMDMGLTYVQSGKNLFAAEGIPNVFFIAADTFVLPFLKSCFDFIFFSLYSYAEKRRFTVIKEIGNILRPKGVVLISAGTPCYRQKTKKEFACFESVDELQRDVSSCGFELIEGAVDPLRPEYMFAVLRSNADNAV